MDLESKIRVIEDFPKEGISFKDITTLLQDGKAFKEAVDSCVSLLDGEAFDLVIGPEARGFIFAAPIAYVTGKGFVPVRKPGKLPAETLRYEYALEYGTDVLEMHLDAVKPGDRVVIADDLLATGGTVRAVADMVEKMGGTVVSAVFLIELGFLDGRSKLGGIPVHSVIQY